MARHHPDSPAGLQLNQADRNGNFFRETGEAPFLTRAHDRSAAPRPTSIATMTPRSAAPRQTFSSLLGRQGTAVAKSPAAAGKHFTSPLRGRSEAKAANNEDEPTRSRQHDESEEHTATVRVADIARRGIPRRDWSIDTVIGREHSHGLYKYIIHWDISRHPTKELQIDVHPGRRRVLVDGRPWQVESLVKFPPIQGIPQTRVRWSDTAHSVWELPVAFSAMAEYDRRHPKPDEELDFGTWGLSILNVHDPEPLSDEEVRGTIDHYLFTPQFRRDYTLAFFYKAEADLHGAGLIVDSAIQFMNMPRRQNLIFSIEFTASGSSYNATRPLLFRILFVQVVGHAHARQCGHCKDKGGPFTKCVSLRAEFAGVCTNCAFAGRGIQCDFHNKNSWKLDLQHAMTDNDAVDEAIPQAAATAASPLPVASSTDRTGSRLAPSSMMPPSGNPTPASELSNSNAGTSNHRKRRRDQENDGHTDVQPPSECSRKKPLPAASFPSPESQPATPPPPDDIYKMFHFQCRRAGSTCINPSTGYILPTNLSHYNNYTVYHDTSMEKGSLTDKQVQYIVSRAPCGFTMILDEGWKAAQGIPGVEAYKTKWSFFSDVWYETLEVGVKRFCGYRENEVIDLCDD